MDALGARLGEFLIIGVIALLSVWPSIATEPGFCNRISSANLSSVGFALSRIAQGRPGAIPRRWR